MIGGVVEAETFDLFCEAREAYVEADQDASTKRIIVHEHYAIKRVRRRGAVGWLLIQHVSNTVEGADG